MYHSHRPASSIFICFFILFINNININNNNLYNNNYNKYNNIIIAMATNTTPLTNVLVPIKSAGVYTTQTNNNYIFN